MYLPKHFAEPDPAALHALICAWPLATLITSGADGLNANHIPLHLEPAHPPHGKLTGHVPRANAVSRLTDATEVLAVFHGPNSYITPNWYATKQDTGRVVPTWNYAVVHAHGRLRIIDDPAWVRAQVETLTRQQEAGSAQPWQVGDAPDDYVAQLVRSLVGVEIEITALLGKVKASQNQPAANRAGVIAGLSATGREQDRAMAELILRYAPPAV